MARESSPEIVFARRGRKRRSPGRAAILALEGASRAELQAAFAVANPFDRSALRIAVDGGLTTFRALRRRPDLFVGDLDSVAAPPRGIPSRIYPVEKDFSDFSGALDEASQHGATVVVIAGLLGGRLDHEWANLLEVGTAAPRFQGLLAPSARGLLAVTTAGMSARVASGRLVSVFALGGGARVSLSGTRWSLSKKRLTPGSLGLSNIATGTVTLAVHDGVAGLVFPVAGGGA